jgi:cyanophycinase
VEVSFTADSTSRLFFFLGFEAPPAVSEEIAMDKQLFLIGGAAEQTLADLVELTNGAQRNLTILCHASNAPRQLGDETAEKFRALGVQNIKVITPRMHDQTLPAGTDLIFMTGGDQSHLVKRSQDSGLAESLRGFNGFIAGTSAGAAAIPETMIAGGMRDGMLLPDALLIGPGLALRDDVIVDTHFAERSRHNRLRSAVASFPHLTGIGLDEDSAVYLNGRSAIVYGRGHVWVFRSAASESWQERALNAGCKRFTAGERFELDK